MNRSYRDPRWDRARSDDDDDEDEDEGEEEQDQGEKSKKGAGPDPIGMKLLETRSVLLTGPVNDAMSKAALAQLLILDAKNNDPIRVYINSPGGSVDCGFAIYDAMRFVKCPVYTVCAGLAASAATVMLLGGAKGHRYSLPHTRFLLHQPSQGIQGQASDVEIGAREIIRIRTLINELFSRETGKPVEEISKDTNRDYWMSAEEAVAYGLIDGIIDAASALDS
jgi:ATP-dependent Clp protease protease subunit